MNHKETLKLVIDRMNEFTKRIETPMDIVFETTHSVGSAPQDASRLFSTCTAKISVRGRTIIEKSSFLETTESNEDQLCKEILTEMIMFSVDSIYNLLVSQDELVAAAKKKPAIITDLNG